MWKYYHAQKFVNKSELAQGQNGYNPNASEHYIREYFQGKNQAGKMNHKSTDETYIKLIIALRESLKFLAKKIEPKVFEYGFMKARVKNSN